MHNAITLSESAASRFKELMAQYGGTILGVRLGVKNSGCAGLTYAIELASEQKTDEEIFENHGIKIFLDPTAILLLCGTELDYKQNKMGASFIFHNPNEKGRCGCGESFCV